jgi:hypothetical protein
LQAAPVFTFDFYVLRFDLFLSCWQEKDPRATGRADGQSNVRGTLPRIGYRQIRNSRFKIQESRFKMKKNPGGPLPLIIDRAAHTPPLRLSAVSGET